MSTLAQIDGEFQVKANQTKRLAQRPVAKILTSVTGAFASQTICEHVLPVIDGPQPSFIDQKSFEESAKRVFSTHDELLKKLAL